MDKTTVDQAKARAFDFQPPSDLEKVQQQIQEWRSKYAFVDSKYRALQNAMGTAVHRIENLKQSLELRDRVIQCAVTDLRAADAKIEELLEDRAVSNRPLILDFAQPAYMEDYRKKYFPDEPSEPQDGAAPGMNIPDGDHLINYKPLWQFEARLRASLASELAVVKGASERMATENFQLCESVANKDSQIDAWKHHAQQLEQTAKARGEEIDRLTEQYRQLDEDLTLHKQIRAAQGNMIDQLRNDPGYPHRAIESWKAHAEFHEKQTKEWREMCDKLNHAIADLSARTSNLTFRRLVEFANQSILFHEGNFESQFWKWYAQRYPTEQ